MPGRDYKYLVIEDNTFTVWDGTKPAPWPGHEHAGVGSWFDYTVNGLIIGNIYALLAVGLALIFGVSHLINFAHGSVYTVGAYIGWTCVTYLHTPLPVTMLIVIVGCALLGMAIERIGLRPLSGPPASRRCWRRSASASCSTSGATVLLARSARAAESVARLAPPGRRRHDRRAGSADRRLSACSAAVLFVFLRFTRLGWAVRATAQDRDAAQQMGVDTDAVNQTVFAIASALGGQRRAGRHVL